MNKNAIESALKRLLANAYPPGTKGDASHRADVIVLRSALRGSPDDAKRWRWAREHLRLMHLHAALDARFKAPDKAYAAEIDTAIDKAIDTEQRYGWVLVETSGRGRARRSPEEELCQLEAQIQLGYTDK